MPSSSNGKFWWLEKGETLHFKLPFIGEGMLDMETRRLKALAIPIMVHISATPFSSGKKQQTCSGRDRCDLCYSKHRPTAKYPVHVLLWGEQYGKHDKSEKIIDMAVSAHNSLLAVIQEMLDNGATEDDILNTEFRLTRLNPANRPYYICTNVQSGDYSENREPAVSLEDKDIKILKALTDILEERKLENPRGSVERTLREKYDWSDAKIELAFSTVLDEDGRYRGENQ